MKISLCVATIVSAACSSAFAQLPQPIKCDPSQSPDQKCFVQQIPKQAQGSSSVIGQKEAINDTSVQLTPPPIQGHPYSGRAVTEFRQTLSNGVHITQTNEALVGRDAQGRTFRTQQLAPIGPWRLHPLGLKSDGSSTITLTVITDPVKNATIEFTSEGQTATSVPLLRGRPNSVQTIDAQGNAAFSDKRHEEAGLPKTAPSMSKTEVPQHDATSDLRYEDLGDQTIQGVQAHGRRTRELIPAGSIGNDREFEIVRDTWTSTELGVVLLSTQSDPRFGETIYSLKELTVTEPDASKFRAPSGYTVKNIAMAKLSVLP